MARLISFVAAASLAAYSCSHEPPDQPAALRLCEMGGSWCGRLASRSGRASLARFARTHSYGLASPDDWIGAVGGIGVDDQGQVYVYDREDPRIIVLSDTLGLHRSFGREGYGPGELSPPYRKFSVVRDWSFNLIDVAKSEIAVYDGEGIEVFELDGTFRRHIGVPPGGSPAYGLRFLDIGPDDDVWYALDVAGTGIRTPRRFQTWRAGVEERSMVWEIPLEEPVSVALSNGYRGTFDTPRQARPLWARSGDRILMLDGSSPWVWTLHIAETTIDSVRLPDWSVPAAGELKVDFLDPEYLRRVSSTLGTGELRPGLPTALKRWAELAVDPDGYLWIKLWELDGRDDVPVLRVDVATGAFERGRLPTFPRAFGVPGVFYAVQFDTASNLPVLTRYEIQLGGGE